MEASVRIFVLVVVMRLSATEEVKKTLRGSVGGNITVPDPVQEKGFLLYEGTNIAMVINREPDIVEGAYMNRLHWDRNTGLFTLTGLQKNDSGIYTIDSKIGNVFKRSYKLTVYDSVAPPTVKKLTVSSEICSLLCSADRETTLLWFKDEEILNQSSSARSLPLTVQDFSSSYRCVAANPAENKSLLVDVNTTCAENYTDSSGDDGHRSYSFLVAVLSIVLALAVILAACIFKQKYFTKNKRTNGQEEGPEVQYGDIRICDKRQGEDSPDSSATLSPSRLTTVYDKLEAHRMIPEPDNV